MYVSLKDLSGGPKVEMGRKKAGRLVRMGQDHEDGEGAGQGKKERGRSDAGFLGRTDGSRVSPVL